MINMSYCRFENTFKALQECLDSLEEMELDGVLPKDKLSQMELAYYNKLYNACSMFVEVDGKFDIQEFEEE